MLALRRVFFRALVVGLGELVLAYAFLPLDSTAAASAGYPLLAAFLAVPAALVTGVELFVERSRPSAARSVQALVLAYVASWFGILVAHLQAIYATGVLVSGRLPEGLNRVVDAWQQLGHDPVVTFLTALAVPFAVTTLLRLGRATTGATTLTTIPVTIFIAIALDDGRIYFRSNTLEEAAVVVSVSLPLLFALADGLARRGAQVDEQNAR